MYFSTLIPPLQPISECRCTTTKWLYTKKQRFYSIELAIQPQGKCQTVKQSQYPQCFCWNGNVHHKVHDNTTLTLQIKQGNIPKRKPLLSSDCLTVWFKQCLSLHASLQAHSNIYIYIYNGSYGYRSDTVTPKKPIPTWNPKHKPSESSYVALIYLW